VGSWKLNSGRCMPAWRAVYLSLKLKIIFVRAVSVLLLALIRDFTPESSIWGLRLRLLLQSFACLHHPQLWPMFNLHCWCIHIIVKGYIVDCMSLIPCYDEWYMHIDKTTISYRLTIVYSLKWSSSSLNSDWKLLGVGVKDYCLWPWLWLQLLTPQTSH
jgi:hypothetical protein